MSDAARTRPSLARPMLVWLVIQLAALAVGAAGVPLSADKPQPPEALSLEVMLVTQAGMAALLWPWAFASWRTGLAVVATALPFTQAAAFLSATPPNDAIQAAVLLALWLLTLAAIPSASLGLTARTVLRATLVTISLGGAAATYLRAEFADTTSGGALGPAVWTVWKNSEFSGVFPWICSGCLLLFAASARFLYNARARRRSGSASDQGGGNGVHVSDNLPTDRR